MVTTVTTTVCHQKREREKLNIGKNEITISLFIESSASATEKELMSLALAGQQKKGVGKGERSLERPTKQRIHGQKNIMLHVRSLSRQVEILSPSNSTGPPSQIGIMPHNSTLRLSSLSLVLL